MNFEIEYMHCYCALSFAARCPTASVHAHDMHIPVIDSMSSPLKVLVVAATAFISEPGMLCIATRSPRVCGV